MTTPPVPADAVPHALRDAELAWHDAGGRRLAFRATRDPCAVLVSELMAQQTQACVQRRTGVEPVTHTPLARRLTSGKT